MDWIGRNLYLADMMGQRIHLVTIDKRQVKSLGTTERLQVTIRANLEGQPKDIAVDPSEG